MRETYLVRLDKASLGFSASHFLVLPGGQCERLHGHNYQVAVELEGPLAESGYVVDFLVLEQLLLDVLRRLDHRTILPTEHPGLRMEAGPDAVEVRWGDRRWVFPRGDCVLLPIESTTAELLARYIARRLLDGLARRPGVPPRRLRVSVGESPGLWGVCELAGSPDKAE